jgi:hypothetical protein
MIANHGAPLVLANRAATRGVDLGVPFRRSLSDWNSPFEKNTCLAVPSGEPTSLLPLNHCSRGLAGTAPAGRSPDAAVLCLPDASWSLGGSVDSDT